MAQKKLIDAVRQGAAEQDSLDRDAELARLRAEAAGLRSKYKSALARIDAERARADAMAGLRGIAPHRARQRPGKAKRHAATMVVLLSDWHVEERVDPGTVNGLNDYSLEVADQRIAELGERLAVMLEHERRLADIRRVVVWLGGDFLSGHIHDDTAELAQLAPLAATRWAGERIRGFLDAAAGQADEVIVATNSGNHGRSTDKLRIGTEMEHSFEQHLYLTLAAAETKANIRWQVGIGGIHVPLNKSIAAWDATLRADLTCLGHWHQFSWGRSGRYVSNGSVIGHSAYAVRIKAAYEPPCQACVVIDHERHETTKAFPLFCDRDLRTK